MATKKDSDKAAAAKKLTLIVSDDKKPSVMVKAGMKLDVVAVSLVTPDLKRAKPIAARLCGGSDTCLALIEL